MKNEKEPVIQNDSKEQEVYESPPRKIHTISFGGDLRENIFQPLTQARAFIICPVLCASLASIVLDVLFWSFRFLHTSILLV